MNHLNRSVAAAAVLLGLGASCALAQDWPQWRGANRDAKASDFASPKTWPTELTQKWKVTVGLGDATPALVGDKLYVFARQESEEVTLCLNAVTGKELWRAKYDAKAAGGPAASHPGPRSSPAVAGGKVVTLGLCGVVSCLDAAEGKKLWRRDDFEGAWPQFFTSSSPIIIDGMCVAQLGGEQKGGIVGYDLASGEPKWKWTDDGTAYASPALLTVGATKMIVTLTAKKIVGIGAADGKLLWESPFAAQGRAYNAATPIIDGQTVIYAGSGRGTKAVKIEKSGDGFTATELWSNPDNAVQFNTPVLKGRQIYGLSQKGDLFCFDAQAGRTLWTASLGGRGFGSVVDAGAVLLALIPQGDLTVFQPGETEYKKLANYKVATTEIYAYPIATGNRIYVKDKESLTLWTLD